MKPDIVDILSELGRRLSTDTTEGLPPAVTERAVVANPWFTAADIRRAARNIADTMLSREALSEWLARYPAQNSGTATNSRRTVLIIMAGNIPFVGMQDLICTLAAGCRAVVKPSSKDTVLMSWVVEQLLTIAPWLQLLLIGSDGRRNSGEATVQQDEFFSDAVIAMGGDQAVAAIREKYVGVPLLLRGNRSSVAVLDGRESPDKLVALADDVLFYSALGCRNVSLLFVPRGYDFTALQNAMSKNCGMLNIKYCNNYRYSRALLKMNDISHIDTGVCLIVEERNFSNSVSVLNYSFYNSISEVKAWLSEHDSEIQCVAVSEAITTASISASSKTLSQKVSDEKKHRFHPRTVAFGQTQCPTLDDYPDGLDTMDFLLSLPAPERPTLVVVVGPTGSGKTDLAVALAKYFGAPIISTDSRQIYRGMKIGTAQPSDSQLAAVPHYFIADRPPTERFTCGDFEREALALLEKLFEYHKIVIAVGGSGLYTDALTDGLNELPDVNDELRKELTDKFSHEGLQPLLDELQALDPIYYEVVDRQNPARVIRALEVCRQTGKPFSSFRSGSSIRKTADFKTSRPFDVVKIGVDMPRTELYERIDRRVDAMMEAGLEDEARTLYSLRDLPALQTVGYRELFYYFNNCDTSDETARKSGLARAVELIKRNSRRYAKRQLTWFRRDTSISWFHPAELDTIIAHLQNVINC